MKKLFFSLVATLAFGSFALANSVELLPTMEVETLDNSTTLEVENNSVVLCLAVYHDVYNCEREQGTSMWDAIGEAQYWFDSCMGYY